MSFRLDLRSRKIPSIRTSNHFSVANNTITLVHGIDRKITNIFTPGCTYRWSFNTSYDRWEAVFYQHDEQFLIGLTDNVYWGMEQQPTSFGDRNVKLKCQNNKIYVDEGAMVLLQEIEVPIVTSYVLVTPPSGRTTPPVIAEDSYGSLTFIQSTTVYNGDFKVHNNVLEDMFYVKYNYTYSSGDRPFYRVDYDPFAKTFTYRYSSSATLTDSK